MEEDVVGVSIVAVASEDERLATCVTVVKLCNKNWFGPLTYTNKTQPLDIPQPPPISMLMSR